MHLSPENTWVIIPAMDEAEWLPASLESLADQTLQGFHVVVCVNQPDHWWREQDRRTVCDHNSATLQWLEKHGHDFPYRLHTLDHASEGKGWRAGEGGVGWARRVAAAEAFRLGGEEILLVSADADTLFDPDYLEQIRRAFMKSPETLAIAAPYYHPLSGDAALDTAMLHYELYLRLMFLNLRRIESPYAFTAIGSALAVTGKGYRKVGGFPHRASGEDFYLLQKIAKAGQVLTRLSARVYPATRLSSRVPYGTGPALSYPLEVLHKKYPVIHPKHFDTVARLYELFPMLYLENIPTPADPFILEQFGTTNIWESLRANAGSLNTFIKACHQKFDGLRTWQWLRKASLNDDHDAALNANIQHFLPLFAQQHPDLNLSNIPMNILIALREELFLVSSR